MDEHEAAKARQSAEMQRAALVVLLDRAGGSVTYTEADYQAIAARFGGTANLAIHVDVLRSEGKPPEVRLTLIRKAPANAELVS